MSIVYRIVNLTRKAAPKKGLVVFEQFDESAFRYLGRFVVADAATGPATAETEFPCRNIGLARERLRGLLEQSQWAVDTAAARKAAKKAAADAARQARSDAAAVKAAAKLAEPAVKKVPVIDKMALLREQLRAELLGDLTAKIAAGEIVVPAAAPVKSKSKRTAQTAAA